MRPSAAQLLQHERLELVFKVSETEKMYVYSFLFMQRVSDIVYRQVNDCKSPQERDDEQRA